jgi:hypothetical protein
MAPFRRWVQSRDVSGEGNSRAKRESKKKTITVGLSSEILRRPTNKEKTYMRSLLTSTLLAAVAVPFLMAAPAVKKAQNTTTSQTTETTTEKPKKHHHKKDTGKTTESSTTSTSETK